MLMNQVLDSSRLLDDRSRPLKRSASVASLPTPPRTHHKRSRSRPRTSLSQHDSDDSDSASELHDDLGGYANRIKRVKTVRNSPTLSDDDEHSEDESPDRKKRRTLRVLPGHDEEEEDENAFWTGRASCGDERERRVQTDKEESSPSPAMLRYHVKAPVSPPPSRRVPTIQPARAASVEREELSLSSSSAAPITPPRKKLFLRAPSPTAADTFKTPTKTKATKIWPERDSPNNPFLIESSDKARLPSEWDSSDDEEVIGEARAREGTPTPSYEEKPTITYVFRGQKATFHNPLYGLAPDVVANSKLPIDHPDFEATEACPPKKLFASVGKQKPRDRSLENIAAAEANKCPKAQPSEDGHDETSEDEPNANETKSRKMGSSVEVSLLDKAEELHAAREVREHKETTAKARLAHKDGLRAGAVFSERDEPARRAMGPLRSV